MNECMCVPKAAGPIVEKLSFHRLLHAIVFFFFFFFFCFLGLHLQHMEVLGLGGKIGAAAAGPLHNYSRPDLSQICDLPHSLQQRRIFSPLSKARGRTHILTDTMPVLNPMRHNRNSQVIVYLLLC